VQSEHFCAFLTFVDFAQFFRVATDLRSIEPHRFRNLLLCVARQSGTQSSIEFVRSVNKHRRHLTPSQFSMAAARTHEYYEAEAKKRMQVGGKKAGRGRPADRGGSIGPPPIETV
jgi:hypothetical protein